MDNMEERIKKYPSLGKVMNEEIESHDGREERLLAWLQAHPARASFADSPSALLDAIDRYASHEEFLINIGSDKGRILREFISKEKPTVLVEIGAYVGYSAVLFADAMRTARPGEQVKVISLERSQEFAEIVRTVAGLAGLEHIIEVVPGDASEGLAKIAELLGPHSIDLLFLDHDESLYIREFRHAVEQLHLPKSTGFVVADNVVRPGAPEYRAYMRGLQDWESYGLPGLIVPGEFEDELEVSRLKAK